MTSHSYFFATLPSFTHTFCAILISYIFFVMSSTCPDGTFFLQFFLSFFHQINTSFFSYASLFMHSQSLSFIVVVAIVGKQLPVNLNCGKSISFNQTFLIRISIFKRFFNLIFSFLVFILFDTLD